MAIVFFTEDIDFKLQNKSKLKRWIKTAALEEGFKITHLNYIFCSDEHLLKINIDYLDHNYYTDIITFDQSDQEKTIEGDIFISIDRVLENAQKLNDSFTLELHRVVIHGLLHLSGYKDKLKEEEKEMREKENYYLSVLNNLSD